MKSAEVDIAPPGRPRTQKYLARREAIIQAAVGLLNKKGLRGMTLGDVAGCFGLAPTAVAYHFRTKESLAAECYLRSLAVLESVQQTAAEEGSTRAALTTLMRGYFALLRTIAEGERSDIARFDDVRPLNDPIVSAAYVDFFRSIRRLLRISGTPGEDRTALNARTHFVVNHMQDVRFWITLYAPQDYARVCDQVLRVMLDGLSARAMAFRPMRDMIAPEPRTAPLDLREMFLRVATSLINIEGYRGASVEKICSALQVTRGAFYHHIDAKDDLMELCLRRSLDVVEQAQERARALPGDGHARLLGVATYLVDHQMAGEAVLIRNGSAQVPDAMRHDIDKGYMRNCLRFAGMVSDGIADGSLRPVDSYIAGRMVDGTVRGASELDQWLSAPIAPRAWDHMVQPLFGGLAPHIVPQGSNV